MSRTVIKGWKTALVCVFVALSLNPACMGALDEAFPSLQIGSITYTNVTVLSKSRTDVFIKFDGGMANFKVKELDTETLTQFGYHVAPPKTNAAVVVAQRLQSDPRVKEMQAMVVGRVTESMRALDARILWGILGGLVLCYLLFCYCSMLICEKTGQKPGVMVWLPVVQVFPLLKAAGMPAWWFLSFLLPVFNVIGSVVWCVKIAQARKKSILTALMLMLPLTNVLAYLYLAFSDGVDGDDEFKPIKLA